MGRPLGTGRFEGESAQEELERFFFPDKGFASPATTFIRVSPSIPGMSSALVAIKGQPGRRPDLHHPDRGAGRGAGWARRTAWRPPRRRFHRVDIPHHVDPGQGRHMPDRAAVRRVRRTPHPSTCSRRLRQSCKRPSGIAPPAPARRLGEIHSAAANTQRARPMIPADPVVRAEQTRRPLSDVMRLAWLGWSAEAGDAAGRCAPLLGAAANRALRRLPSRC